MKKAFLLIVLNFTVLAFSQGEANIWYFGQNAGLDFNSGSPIPLTNGEINSQESCGSIADANGQLLFYTDGLSVFNRNHIAMPNGTGLLGHESASQSGTIVPKPGSNTVYYIFTTDAENRPNGFRYTVVDMSLDGGFGAVTSEKNVLITTPTLESIGVIKKANNTDYWIVTHDWNNNNFLAYSLTSTGLSTTPVISSVGAVITGADYFAAGIIKIAPSGSKLAFTSVSGVAQLFDFNNNTGVVSNPLTLLAGIGFQLYGVEFSPNESVLYLVDSLNKVYQFDLSANDIPNSKITLYNGNKFPAALQLAPDGKIYLAVYTQNKLGVIDNPNIVGLGCGFQISSIDLGGKISRGGLPSFNRTFFDTAFKVENFCFGSATSFTLTSTQNVTGTTWDFGDGSPVSNSINASHVYANPGVYPITVTITGTSGSVTRSKSITIYPTPIVAATIPNQSVCGVTTVNYDLSQHNNALLGIQSTSVFGVAYFTSMANAVAHTNVLTTNYSLSAGTSVIYAKVYNLSNMSCYAISSFTLTLSQTPTANAPTPNWVCDDSSNDGIGIFNLGINSPIVLGSQSSSQFAVSYHLSQNDADTNSNALPLSYQNISNPQTIYVRVVNNQSVNCFSTTSFQIGLNALPIIANLPTNLYACDAGNDSLETFDLSQQTATILGTQSSADFTVSYHTNLSDANSSSNDVSLSFTTTSNPQTIYARVENNASTTCFATTSFQLQIMPEPVLIMDDLFSNCEGNVLPITAPVGFSSYNWSNGATTSSTSISIAGNYSLTVTKDYGFISCPTTKNFTVYNSNIATITAIETRDWTDNQNMISVQVTGNGDYEYSVDGIHYQDSNVFQGLSSGEYTIYVNDKKGCGEVSEEVFLLMYPKFFTPNGDGFNDKWFIKFSNNTEPEMELLIFDRYGKIITSFKGLDYGWDGNFNGKLQIADDYWFVVKRQNGKEFSGHFSLKR